MDPNLAPAKFDKSYFDSLKRAHYPGNPQQS